MAEPVLLSGGLMALLVPAVSLWLILRWFRARDRRLDGQAMQASSADGVVVPVKALQRRSGSLFGGWSRNSMKPAMSIAPDGIRFRVLTKDAWPFTDIGQVDARKTWFGVRLVFVKADGSILAADLRDASGARRVLTALPQRLKLTARAARLRDTGFA